MMLRSLLVSAALVALAAPASATTYLFTLSNGATGSWTLPASPEPDGFSSGEFFFMQGVTGTFNGAPLFEFLFFYTTGSGGGVGASDSNGLQFDLYGPQLFTGPLSAPTFTLSTFNMTTSGGDPRATLTIAAVPEAGTWAMMIAGFGLMGAGLRRRRATVQA
jgi:hypothetical protein